MGLATVLLYASAIVAAVYVYGLRLVQRFQYRHFPGPKPNWLLGGVTLFRKIGQHNAYQEWGNTYGPGPHVIHLAGQPTVCLTDPEMARKILYGGTRPNFAKDSVMPPDIRRRVQHSILLLSGQRWRDIRAAWQPMFFTGSLEGYMGIMDQSAQWLVKEIGWAVGKGRLDIQQPIQDMTLNVVGRSAFGLDLHTQQAEQAVISEEEREQSDRLRQALGRFFISPATSIWVMAARLIPVLLPLIRFLASKFPDKTLVQLIASRNEAEGVVQALVDEHEEKLGLENHNLKENGEYRHSNGDHAKLNGKAASVRRGVAPGSFIDLLVKRGNTETGQKFSKECIVQQALTMLLAGYETTASALTFTIYLLSRSCNKEKQAKLIEEVDTLGRDWVPSYDTLEEKMPYLDAIINESLRILPPAFLTLRQTEAPLEVDGYHLRQGSWVTVSPYAIQNDPRVWGPDAHVFTPERWMTQDPAAAKAMKKGFFAFGNGPRVCPGSRFAIIEIKLALIRIFQTFTLDLLPDQEPLAIRDSITIAAKNGVYVKPSPRNGSVQG